MSAAADTFEQFIRRGTAAELTPFLLALDKSDIVPVRTRAKSLHKELDEYVKRADGHWSRLMQPEQDLMLFLAGIATYSQKEAFGRSLGSRHYLRTDARFRIERDPLPWVWAVLRHTRPAWLTEWLVRNHRSNPWTTPDFDTLQALAAEGLLNPTPTLLAYAAARQLDIVGGELDTAFALRQQQAEGKKKLNALQVAMWADLVARWPALAADSPGQPSFRALLLDALRSNAALLGTGLPLLFEFDTPADSTVAYCHSIKPVEDLRWLDVLPVLVESGHLDRARLLTDCLLALRRDFRRPLLTWFKELFLTLQPTLAERLARQNELVELLAHPLPQVINFALDQFKELWTHPDFEPATLLLYADGLMTRPDLKTGLKNLFGGLDKLLKTNPALTPEVARLHTAALAHPDAGVQERAAKGLAVLLGAKKPLLDASAAADTIVELDGLGELLGAPARALLAAWLTAAPALAAETAVYAPRAEFTPDISDATAIAPVADWHELLFLTGQALQPDQPEAQERWLDGLLRLRTQYPPDYAQQLRPYLLQALPYLLKGKTEPETLELLRNFNHGQGRNGQHELLLALLLGWYGGFAQPQVARVRLAAQHQLHPDPLLALARQRLLAAEARLRAGGAALPLLSTPSHAPHWVAPSALLARLLAYEAAGAAPDAADLALALGRLAWNAPAEAETARPQLRELRHAGLRELLGWLLAPARATPPLPVLKSPDKSLLQKATSRFSQWVSGEAPAPPTLDDALPWLWAVAARTRCPHAALPALAALADYPGLAAPWVPTWDVRTRTEIYKQSWNQKEPERTYHYHELAVDTATPAPPPSPLLLYSLHARLPQKDHTYFWALAEDYRFLLSLLPNNPAPLRWHLLRSAFRTSDGYSEEHSLLSKQLHALLADGPAYDDSASTLLAVGLLYNLPTGRALAWEVVLAAAANGRLVPAALGAALGRLLASAYAPVLRLAEALPAARGISPATDDALRQLLDALLPELPAEPLRNTAKLLAAYADLRPRDGSSVPAVVADKLQIWQATGSLKKAAVALLAE
ncbi:DUF6493 family protein [Hymenobacter ruricola]|uniref:HEAT repeat domain-containing protein n=1 Tax=Hymenobacter ruricola TaxID=2791023 RepID=A0ABS0I2Y9_9BACT|nr:DUF6493 family protein [Hymenobacter ruricola]MBF9221311.1 hypothetical protein [Hymenobacter ruricola]